MADAADDECQEARQRSAISRAYYAVLCSARDHLVSHGASFSRDRAIHDAVPAELKKGDASHKSVANALDQLKKDRGPADYDTTFTGGTYAKLQYCVDYGLKVAEKALDTLESI